MIKRLSVYTLTILTSFAIPIESAACEIYQTSVTTAAQCDVIYDGGVGSFKDHYCTAEGDMIYAADGMGRNINLPGTGWNIIKQNANQTVQYHPTLNATLIARNPRIIMSCN